MKKILFVCTGNTCRSPMAAGIMNFLIKKYKIKDCMALSAGIAAQQGEPASKNAVLSAAQIGVDLNSHVSKSIEPDMIHECERIYTMTQGHRQFLISIYPEFKDKIFLLGNGIPDPFGGGIEEYEQCRDSIFTALCDLIKEMQSDDTAKNS